MRRKMLVCHLVQLDLSAEEDNYEGRIHGGISLVRPSLSGEVNDGKRVDCRGRDGKGTGR